MSVVADKVAEVVSKDGLAIEAVFRAPSNGVAGTGIPGSLLPMPCAVIRTLKGRWSYSLGGPAKEEHDIQITVFTASTFLAEAMDVAAHFVTPMRDKFAANMKLDATPSVDKILPTPGVDVYEGPGGIEWGDKTMTGVLFRYTVFEDETGNYTVAI